MVSTSPNRSASDKNNGHRDKPGGSGNNGSTSVTYSAVKEFLASGSESNRSRTSTMADTSSAISVPSYDDYKATKPTVLD